MADATALPTLEYFQWSRPDAPNPRLAAPITSTITTLNFTTPPLDKDGKIVSNELLIGVKNIAGYTESIYIPAGGIQGYGNVPDSSNLGTTATGCVRGINTAGLDFSTTAGLAAAHEQDSPVFCNVSAIHFEMMQAVMKGTIASGGENWQMGNEANNDITVYAANGDTNKPFWRYDADQGTTGGWIYSDDGVSTQPFGDGSGLTGGDGITVSGGSIAVDVTDTVIFKNSSAGAGDANIVPLLDVAGRLDSTITGATYTEVAQLSGTTNIAEADTFFGATDITGAQAEELTDGSTTTLHGHNVGFPTDVVTTQQIITGTSAATNIMSFTLPGGSLGTDNMLKITAYISDIETDDATDDLNAILIYGSTTVISAFVVEDDSVTNVKGTVTYFLIADGSTSAQKGAVYSDVGRFGTGTSNSFRYWDSTGSATENSTGDLTVTAQLKHNSADADQSVTIEYVTAELIQRI